MFVTNVTEDDQFNIKKNHVPVEYMYTSFSVLRIQLSKNATPESPYRLALCTSQHSLDNSLSARSMRRHTEAVAATIMIKDFLLCEFLELSTVAA